MTMLSRDARAVQTTLQPLWLLVNDQLPPARRAIYPQELLDLAQYAGAQHADWRGPPCPGTSPAIAGTDTTEQVGLSPGLRLDLAP